MEPVPETERMEEFRPSPLPTVRLEAPAPVALRDSEPSRKPFTIRRSTEPPSPTSSPSWAASPSWSASTALPYRPRTTSPLSGTHTRSKSTASLGIPSIGRTRSMPGVDGAGRILYPPAIRPSSPSGSPSRNRTPRKPVDEAFPSAPVRSSVLDSDRKPQPPERSSSPVFNSSAGGPPPRTASPLRYATSTAVPSQSPTPSSLSTSPSFRSDSSSLGYNFPFHYPSSSIPSTPSSVRSRSPSISSLETIPDTPDAEEAALEADRIASLKAAAEAADGGESGGDTKGRSSLDAPTRGRTMGIGTRDKRKRWSVCGAERRGDLDLETIWED